MKSFVLSLVIIMSTLSISMCPTPAHAQTRLKASESYYHLVMEAVERLFPRKNSAGLTRVKSRLETLWAEGTSARRQLGQDKSVNRFVRQHELALAEKDKFRTVLSEGLKAENIAAKDVNDINHILDGRMGRSITYSQQDEIARLTQETGTPWGGPPLQGMGTYPGRFVSASKGGPIAGVSGDGRSGLAIAAASVPAFKRLKLAITPDSAAQKPAK